MQVDSSAHEIKDKVDLTEDKKDSHSDQEEQTKISAFGIFRYADKWDWILMLVGSVAAGLMGASMPVFALLWGNITDSFLNGGDEMVNASRDVMFQFLYIGAAVFVAGVLMFGCWMIAGERQAITCRK